MVCGAWESISRDLLILTVLAAGAAARHAHACEPWARKKEGRLFPAPVSTVSKKDAAPALPGGPSLPPACPSLVMGPRWGAPWAESLLFQDDREEENQGQAGESLEITLAGET